MGLRKGTDYVKIKVDNKTEEVDMKKQELEDQLAKELKKRNLTSKEIIAVLAGLKQTNTRKFAPKKINFPNNHIKFGVFTDIHIGHKDYRPDVLRKMIADGERFGIEFWLNAGDTIEGMSGREGHIYELDHIGYSAQMDFFAKEFSLFKNTVYSIEAQDSHSGWYRNKGNMGLSIGEELDARAEHYKFIGYDEQDIEFSNGLKIRLRHPGGGTAYAVSYKLQKYVESISGGDKPSILIHGHFHKSMYMLYRNIHCFEGGCICNQTPFMKKIGTPAMVGYWLLDVTMYTGKEFGIERINHTFVPFY
jgi:hypothetical protein